MKKKLKKGMKKGGTALCLCALLALGGCTKTADSGTVQMSQTVEENTQPMTETPEAETLQTFRHHKQVRPGMPMKQL